MGILCDNAYWFNQRKLRSFAHDNWRFMKNGYGVSTQAALNRGEKL